VLSDTIHLFEVPPRISTANDRRTGVRELRLRRSNPPRGATISYYLKEMQPDGVKVVITTATGDTVRTLTGPGFPGLRGSPGI